MQFLLISRVFCQQNGDVRLNEHGYFYTDKGILEVFLTEANGWVPVCYDRFNDGAAATACRQMGYCSYVNFEEGGKLGNFIIILCSYITVKLYWLIQSIYGYTDCMRQAVDLFKYNYCYRQIVCRKPF